MRVLITGGAGFIGSNATARLLELGHDVILVDNLSRPKVNFNLDWLRSLPAGRRLRLSQTDVRDGCALSRLLQAEQPDFVIHLAAQVAVTTSVTDPRHDFEVNALGTLNVLEAARALAHPPVVLYASTNKVYGKLDAYAVERSDAGYKFRDLPNGVPESVPLDFYSPYGCSKGAADQYVLDYARIYGLRTVALRQSCIYGTHQFGVEDQGWIAWFAIAAATGRPITIYGDGHQVRDVLWIDDLVDLYLRVYERIEHVSGRAFNAGGGTSFSLSLLESIELIGRRLGRHIPLSFGDWRPGDQRIFVADASLAQDLLGWRPSTPPGEGINRLIDWIQANASLF